MSILEKDMKLLWGRAANRCAICKVELAEDKSLSNESFPIGEQAHIVAKESGGPRGKSILTIEERDSYHNLILLCPTHHTVIDKNVDDYPIEKLHMIKSQHELWVKYALSSFAPSQVDILKTDENLLLIFIKKWVQFCDFYQYFHIVIEARIHARQYLIERGILKEIYSDTEREEEIRLMQEWHRQIKELREMLFHLGEESLLVRRIHAWEELKDEDSYISRRNYQSPFSYMLDFNAPEYAVNIHGKSLWKAWQISYSFLEYLSFVHDEVKGILDRSG